MSKVIDSEATIFSPYYTLFRRYRGLLVYIVLCTTIKMTNLITVWGYSHSNPHTWESHSHANSPVPPGLAFSNCKLNSSSLPHTLSSIQLLFSLFFYYNTKYLSLLCMSPFCHSIPSTIHIIFSLLYTSIQVLYYYFPQSPRIAWVFSFIWKYFL